MTSSNNSNHDSSIAAEGSPVFDSFYDSALSEDCLNFQSTPLYPASTSIAIPENLQHQTEHSPQSASSTDKSRTISSSDNDNSRKRKTSEDDDNGDSENTSNRTVKKTAHKVIEKRYRTNLNDKFTALRNSVPSLRMLTKSARGEDTAGDGEDLQGLTPARKLNKATIMEKAVEYIHHLEKRNARLTEKRAGMRVRIAAFEKLFMSGLLGINPLLPTNPHLNVQEPYQTSSNHGRMTPRACPQGMIDVPGDFRILRAANRMKQQTYQIPQERYEPANCAPIDPNEVQNGGGYFGKMMVGSLAGLMILEGFSETEQDGRAPNARGLFAFPTQILCSMGRYLRASSKISVLSYHLSAGQTLALLKLILVFGALLSFFIPSAFKMGSKMKDLKTLSPSVAATPSLASSIQVRRQAWLTAIQTVWAPRNNFFLEAAALCLMMIKLNIRNIIGWYDCALLTGITEQQEATRVRTWGNALDTQLAGGNVEVCKSRLVLTLMASGTLPDTPVRLMLKALHIRVLFWETGNSGFNGLYILQGIAAKFARSKWNKAKELQELASHQHVNSREQDYEPLPEHLAALLEQECDHVLDDSIGQRAYNLVWNLPTTHNAIGPSDGMDDVVNDHAIRSPLDAVAAWRSALIVQKALRNSLGSDDSGEENIASGKGIEQDINVAVKTAPVGSRVQLRALVARAVVFDEKRDANIAQALEVLAPLEPQDSDPYSVELPTLIISSIASIQNLKMSLNCATAVAQLKRSPSPATPTSAFSIDDILPTSIDLLGFIAAFKLMETLLEHEDAYVNCSHILEHLASTLRIWIGGAEGRMSGLKKETKVRVAEKCISIVKKSMGIDEDVDNQRMSEEETEEEC